MTQQPGVTHKSPWWPFDPCPYGHLWWGKAWGKCREQVWGGSKTYPRLLHVHGGINDHWMHKSIFHLCQPILFNILPKLTVVISNMRCYFLEECCWAKIHILSPVATFPRRGCCCLQIFWPNIEIHWIKRILSSWPSKFITIISNSWDCSFWWALFLSGYLCSSFADYICFWDWPTADSILQFVLLNLIISSKGIMWYSVTGNTTLHASVRLKSQNLGSTDPMTFQVLFKIRGSMVVQ